GRVATGTSIVPVRGIGRPVTFANVGLFDLSTTLVADPAATVLSVASAVTTNRSGPVPPTSVSRPELPTRVSPPPTSGPGAAVYPNNSYAPVARPAAATSTKYVPSAGSLTSSNCESVDSMSFWLTSAV